MTERHLSKYVSSTSVNSCDSFSGFAEAHEVTEGLSSSSSPLSATSSRRALWPTLTVAATRRLATTMLTESADAEPLEEAGASSASPYARLERAVAKREVRWKDIQALMDAMEARTKHNKA
eukprot:6197221-Pleurochrysis_carterae.AAC.4